MSHHGYIERQLQKMTTRCQDDPALEDIISRTYVAYCDDVTNRWNIVKDIMNITRDISERLGEKTPKWLSDKLKKIDDKIGRL